MSGFSKVSSIDILGKVGDDGRYVCSRLCRLELEFSIPIILPVVLNDDRYTHSTPE